MPYNKGFYGPSRNSPELPMAATPSATCPRESVLPVRLRPDFLVVFGGYAGVAEHRHGCQAARKRSLRADILQTS
jgi:hypothetical protein